MYIIPRRMTGTANGAGAAQEPTPEVNQRLYAHTEKLTGQGLYWDIILLDWADLETEAWLRGTRDSNWDTIPACSP
jgi:hypothetical protein